MAGAHLPLAEARLSGRIQPTGAAELALPLLLRLRWMSAAGQLGVLTLAWWVADAALPYPWMYAIAGLLCASNGALERCGDRRRLAKALPAILALDTLLLTLQLALSGGPTNPFTALYIVHVALAAVALRIRGTVFIAALSGLCYAALFLWHVEQSLWGGEHAGAGHGAHLAGMWIALTVVAALIAYALGRLSRQLVAARAAAARNDRLASLTTLAAGAAHELGSPLGTIAVAAREIERESRGGVREDAVLIRAEVERCREILDRMSGAANPAALAPEPLPLASILESALAELGERRARIELCVPPSLIRWVADARRLRPALVALLRNALDASAEPVELRVENRDGELRLRVRDRGAGIPAGVFAHLGEPFFTTKEPGRGTGLGLYLVRLVAEQLGGELSLRSTEGEGTDAVLALPAPGLAGTGPAR